MGIVATIGANLAHGLNYGPIGALVSACPALVAGRKLRTRQRSIDVELSAVRIILS